MTRRIFLLSPANCSGRRAEQLLSPRAEFALAQQLRSTEGAPLGAVFSFVSGLYFRGKLAYATRFSNPPQPIDVPEAGGTFVITPTAGLVSAESRVTIEVIRHFATVDVNVESALYREPLERAASALRSAVGTRCEVVLLGSIASGKYVDVLLPVFGTQLVFPVEFVGRGDMSRGGLMLRCVGADAELEYVPVDGSSRRGRRPPKLAPVVRSAQLARGLRDGR
jgi:hypothetical protein